MSIYSNKSHQNGQGIGTQCAWCRVTEDLGTVFSWEEMVTRRPYASSSSERIVGKGPLHSPSFTIISCCPDHLCSELYVLENITQPAALWSGFLLQSGTDVVPASSSTDTCRASCAGALSGRRCLTFPKRASLLSPMTVRMSGRPVFLATDEFVTKSDHQIPRMRHWHCMWKACNRLPSALRMVYVSAQWRRTDWTQDVYILNFVQRLRRDCF